MWVSLVGKCLCGLFTVQKAAQQCNGLTALDQESEAWVLVVAWPLPVIFNKPLAFSGLQFPQLENEQQLKLCLRSFYT